MKLEIKISQKPVEYKDAIELLEERVKKIQNKESNNLLWILEHPNLYSAGTSAKNNDLLNKNIADYSSIEIKSIGEIEISILRQSIFEIENSDIDYPIVINEAVKLAKKFGQEDSYRFINGLLDSYIAAR